MITTLPKPTEHDEQTALFDWANLLVNRFPQLNLMFAIPNGGFRAKTTAASLKREGVKAGVPDIFLPVVSKGNHGLFIEMKVSGGFQRPDQREWSFQLNSAGYFATVCFSWQEAAMVISQYLELPADVINSLRANERIPA